MRQNKSELDVDFIGGAEPLTKEEEKAISEFLKSSKQRKEKSKGSQNRNNNKNKSTGII